MCNHLCLEAVVFFWVDQMVVRIVLGLFEQCSVGYVNTHTLGTIVQRVDRPFKTRQLSVYEWWIR